jgi:hypothetical protein
MTFLGQAGMLRNGEIQGASAAPKGICAMVALLVPVLSIVVLRSAGLGTYSPASDQGAADFGKPDISKAVPLRTGNSRHGPIPRLIQSARQELDPWQSSVNKAAAIDQQMESNKFSLTTGNLRRYNGDWRSKNREKRSYRD